MYSDSAVKVYKINQSANNINSSKKEILQMYNVWLTIDALHNKCKKQKLQLTHMWRRKSVFRFIIPVKSYNLQDFSFKWDVAKLKLKKKKRT